MEIDLNRLDLIHAGQSDPGTMAVSSPSPDLHAELSLPLCLRSGLSPPLLFRSCSSPGSQGTKRSS